MKKYNKPLIIVLSKEQVSDLITARASCKNALCIAGTTFTCNQSVNYTCDNYTGNDPISCPQEYSFTCGSAHLHVDSAINQLG